MQPPFPAADGRKLRPSRSNISCWATRAQRHCTEQHESRRALLFIAGDGSLNQTGARLLLCMDPGLVIDSAINPDISGMAQLLAHAGGDDNSLCYLDMHNKSLLSI